jgi:dihydroorotase
LGHISEGAIADLVAIRLEEGKFGYIDSSGAMAPGTKRLTAEVTLKDGRVEWDLNGRAGVDWRVHYDKM